MSSISPYDEPQKGDPPKIDFAIVARDLKLSPEKIDAAVELLDQGNTISFVTRFRKDLTGGLDEKQILAIKNRVAQLRALGERKDFVLRSIESQGKLTDELKTEILKASTSRRLEDLYLPFKPKKRSRALVARQQGLEALADEIFNAKAPGVDLATRATEFVRVDKGLNTVDDVFKGVRTLLSERFSDKEVLRGTLRKILWDQGKLATQVIETQAQPSDVGNTDDAKPSPAPDVKQQSLPQKTAGEETANSDTAKPEIADSETAGSENLKPETTRTSKASQGAVGQIAAAGNETVLSPSVEPVSESDRPEPSATETTLDARPTGEPNQTSRVAPQSVEAFETTSAQATDRPFPVLDNSEKPDAADENPETAETDQSKTKDAAAATTHPVEAPSEGAVKPKKKKKKKKKKKVEDPYKDYRDFKKSLKQLAHHTVLAINRGERAGKLKVKISVDNQNLEEPAFAALVPADHPFHEFIQKCAGEALSRNIVPSLEREIRRELTEAAEKHAVEVFANNLRNLLLQPPLRNKTVLAIDPGFKRGCSVAVLDSCGAVLDSGHIFVVGNQNRQDESKQKLANWAKKHSAEVIAIGNGAACRQTEQLVSDMLGENAELSRIKYVMVNEAGASIYSTSEIGREELPDATPSIRSAISIGRRLQDPLSELVKISPANIGVGMYQHDVKAKHLSESLDDVVAFCVNQVGVNVNTASPSLLKYVSGLNALTARRLVEHREANGKFENRESLKQVNGIGDATFVQAAGFLRIHDGDNPLDSTSIHPESYSLANDVLKRADVSLAELFVKPQAAEVSATTQETPSADSKPKTEPATSLQAVAEQPTEQTKTERQPATDSAEPSRPESSESTEASKAAVSADVEPKIDAQPAANSPAATTSKVETEPTPVPVAATRTVLRLSPEELAKRKELLKRMSDLDIAEISKDHSAGRLLVKDILMALKRPDWDPRGNSKKLIFRRGIIKSDDLKLEMQLEGQVANVVDFGVFVDIGLGESSLVHVSQLSNHFVRDPHQLYAVGDVLKVWVSEIDSERRRVKLTAVRPGSKAAPKRRRKYEGPKTDGKPGERTGPGKPASKFGGGGSGRKYEGSKPASGRSRSFSKGSSFKNRPKRKPKPKPVKPITDGMLEGKEPMRSFSDLAQFVKNSPKKKGDGDDKDAKKS